MLFKHIDIDPGAYDVWEYEGSANAFMYGVATTTEGDDVRFTLCMDRDTAAFFVQLDPEDLDDAGLGLSEERATDTLEKALKHGSPLYSGPAITPAFIASCFE